MLYIVYMFMRSWNNREYMVFVYYLYIFLNYMQNKLNYSIFIDQLDKIRYIFIVDIYCFYS